jgi:signal transduction histidine kinase/GAF domain-containing protein
MSISQILNRKQIFEDLCEAVQNLGFDFAAISLVSTEHNTIEAVHGSKIFREIEGRAKHFLADEYVLRDIQADIVINGFTEVISGWDDRFDRWIYEEFNHDQLTRVFSPLVICKDSQGRLIDNWYQHGQWIKRRSNSKNKEKNHRIFEFVLDPDVDYERIVIGTVETGFCKRGIHINNQMIIDLNNLMARHAVPIWKTKLLSLLEELIQEAVEFLNVDAASIHYLYDRHKNSYVYQAYSVGKGYSLLRGCQPRQNGIGRQAINSGTAQFSPSRNGQPVFDQLNPSAYSLGFRSIVAFPLKLALESLFPTENLGNSFLSHEAVLYIGSQKEQPLMGIVEHAKQFTFRASETIQQVLIYKYYQERNRQLTTLHYITKALADVSHGDTLLNRITWDGMNILAADLVTLYEYRQSSNSFDDKPITAGRLCNQPISSPITNDNHILPWLVDQPDNIYLNSIEASSRFASSFFVQREKISSVAAIQLRVSDEIVGVMFINFRRLHDFSFQKEIIVTLASSAAIAIKNHRWLNSIRDIGRMVITSSNQQQLFNLILEQAVMLSTAESATLKLRDLNTKRFKLDIKATFPSKPSLNVPVHSLSQKTVDKIEEKVVKGLRSTVEDIDACAILCVPLLDSESVLQGVLTLQSSCVTSFRSKHLLIDALGFLAIIGLHNIHLKDQLIHEKEVSMRGVMSLEVVHQMNNTIGAIKLRSQRILDMLHRNERPEAMIEAQTIIAKADNLLMSAKTMKDMTSEEKAYLKIDEVINDVLNGLDIPNNIFLHLKLEKGCPSVYAGRVQLKIIFNNLIHNALDAMSNGGRLTIEGSLERYSEDSTIIIKLSDTGHGIEDHHIGEIFNYGFTTKDGIGKGSGLWISKSTIELLGGEIIVASKLNHGSEFTLRFPIKHYISNTNLLDSSI